MFKCPWSTELFHYVILTQKPNYFRKLPQSQKGKLCCRRTWQLSTFSFRTGWWCNSDHSANWFLHFSLLASVSVPVSPFHFLTWQSVLEGRCFQTALRPHMPEKPTPFCFHLAALRQHLRTSFPITFPCNCSVCLLGARLRLWGNSCVCVTWNPFRTQVLWRWILSL